MSLQLSSIDLIDPAGIPMLQFAYDRLLERRYTQTNILTVVNVFLDRAGVPPISRSAFNRWSLRVRAGKAPRPVLTARSQ